MSHSNGKKSRVKLLWRNAAILLLLSGFFSIAANEIAAQSSPCDPIPALVVTRTSLPFVDPQTNQTIGYSRFDILRSGQIDHYIHLFVQLPANTVLKAYFNGVEIATLDQNLPGTTDEYWSWEGLGTNPPIARVGDIMSVTKNGQPFVSGTYIREQYNSYAQVAGYTQNGNPFPCSLLRADSITNILRISFSNVFYAPAPITRLTLNEPGQQPGVPGPEILTLPLRSTGSNQPPGWHYATITAGQIPLTENQYSLLRQGLLSIVTYTAEHPDGYSQMYLVTQAINAGGDFEGDGRADLAVFRPSERNWYLQFSSNNQVQTLNFGLSNDKLVVGDYDSDNKADITAFQTDNPNYPGQGVWQILQSSDNTLRTIAWGSPGDIPLAINADANNTSDLGIFRPSTGTWYLRRMGDIIKPLAENFGGEPEIIIQWGMAGDKALAGDFSGDGIDELVVFRPSEGNWYIYNYTDGSYQILHWGSNGDIPMAKDFDGDAKADPAVYRPAEGIWYILSSLDNSLIIRYFGLPDDIPVPADFDKDGVADVAVFRPSNGTWYVLRSSNNSFFAAQFGLNGDIPAMAQR